MGIVKTGMYFGGSEKWRMFGDSGQPWNQSVPVAGGPNRTFGGT